MDSFTTLSALDMEEPAFVDIVNMRPTLQSDKDRGIEEEGTTAFVDGLPVEMTMNGVWADAHAKCIIA